MAYRPKNLAELVTRWEQVIRVLRGLTRHQVRKHWDMGVLLEETECGTIGCAAGFCSLDPWFRRRGLKSKRVVHDLPGETKYIEFEIPPVTAFFDTAGCDDTFWNSTQRPPSKVIKEITAHIRKLKSGDVQPVFSGE